MSRNRRRRRNSQPLVVAEPAAEPTSLNPQQPQTPVRRVSASISAFQGPLPPPELLERYSQIVPNGADRIVAMAESQLQHRQSLESAVVNGNVAAQSRGQIMGFILGLVAILGGYRTDCFRQECRRAWDDYHRFHCHGWRVRLWSRGTDTRTKAQAGRATADL